MEFSQTHLGSETLIYVGFVSPFDCAITWFQILCRVFGFRTESPSLVTTILYLLLQEFYPGILSKDTLLFLNLFLLVSYYL